MHPTDEPIQIARRLHQQPGQTLTRTRARTHISGVLLQTHTYIYTPHWVGDAFLLAMGSLASRAAAENQAVFRPRPKSHRLQCRIIDRLRDGSRMNPRYYACWSSESFIGKVCRVSRRSHPSASAKATLCRHQVIVSHAIKKKFERSW